LEPQLRPCELNRAKHELLTDLRRPRAAKLGKDSIRFSSQPALGGNAFAVEILKSAGGRGFVRIYWAWGHAAFGWELRGSARTSMSADDYRKLAATVDDAFAKYPGLDASPDTVAMVCSDGPGYLTERVRQGKVATLTGHCSPGDDPHGNRRIAAAMLRLACPSMRADEPDDLAIRKTCEKADIADLERDYSQ
jgi:hypothetical protein